MPYANLTNPQTLNLYAMVSDNPESFADLDGHFRSGADDWFASLCNSALYSSMLSFLNYSEQQYIDAQNASSATAQGQQQEQTAQTQQQGQNQNAQKHLSAEDVSDAIKSAKEDKGPHAKIAVDILNSLGKNWVLSGDTLRQALKDSGVNAHGVDKNVDSVSRTGDRVTVQLNKALSFLKIYKTERTIRFDVGAVDGRPALTNIVGVEVFHGYHYVPKTQYGPD